jgi:hypothetical protein
MSMNRITIERILYTLALLLGLGFRLLQLGAAPLSDYEANWALQALDVSRGQPVNLGPAPGYVSLTGILFFLLGDSNAIARLLPALAGSLLVLLPLAFRGYLARYPHGNLGGLILAFGLALDPGLVAASRLAGGPMLAAGFGLLALGFAYNRRPLLAGVLGGLALLSGPPVLLGALGLAVAWAASGLLADSALPATSRSAPDGYHPELARAGALAAGGTILLAGTLFFRQPQGLGALAGTFPAFLAGWVNASGIPVSRLLAALLFYQPLALAFGLAAAVRGWISRERLPRGLSLWFGSALILALLFPGRQVTDLVWVLVPLWALAALELARQSEVFEWERLPALGQAILVFLLLSLAWINLAGLSQSGIDPQVLRLRWAVIGGTLFLGAVTTVLVALGWSVVIAQRGLAWGLAASFSLYLLSGTWGISQLRSNSPQELWSPPPTTHQAALLLDTLGDLSEWRTGQRGSLDIQVASESPSLRWALRNWEKVSFQPLPGPDEVPSVILRSGDESSPSLTVAYRGQDFAWWAYPDWPSGLPQDWPRWLVFRQGPQREEHIILWARGDLFPDGSLAPVEENQDPEPVFPEDEEFLP